MAACASGEVAKAFGKEAEYDVLKVKKEQSKACKERQELGQSVEMLQSDANAVHRRLQRLDTVTDDMINRLKYLEEYHETKVRPALDYLDLQEENTI